MTWEPLRRAFLERPASVVAPELLGKLVVVRRPAAEATARTGDGSAVGPPSALDVRVGRIVEVEAYEQHEPASHTFRGRTPRNAVMFGPPGHLYVYFSYGVHWCANVVCDAEGTGSAVLLRGLAPLAGLEAMAAVRPAARRVRDLANGPGKLCAALGITGADNGIDLLDADGPVVLAGDGTAPPSPPAVSRRIGITKAVELPWRFSVPGDVHVSGPRRSGRGA